MEIRPYARELATRGELNLSTLSKETTKSLEAAGIGRADLEKIAGADRVIRGEEFEKIFTLLEARADKSTGKNDIGRAQNVYESLSKELDRTSTAPTSKSASFSRAGLRDEIASARTGARSVAYKGVDLPEVTSDRKTPDKPSWIARLLEAIFDFLPGVTTDTDRLKAYGRDLADRHAAEIVGFRAGHERDAKTHGPFNPAGDPIIDHDAAMTAHLAERFQKEHGISEDAAYTRARVVVGAMNQRLEQMGAAAAKDIKSIPGIKETASKSALDLASVHAIVKDEVSRGGPLWEARFQRAMKDPPADHPYFTANPGRNKDEISNAIKRENLEMVAYAMALEKGGKLENIPPAAVDGLLDVHFTGKTGDFAVADAITALDSMSSKDDGKLYQKIDALPADRRAIAYEVLANEHFLLRSTSATDRAGAIARATNAADRLATKDPTELAGAKQAFAEGRLGLDQHDVQLEHTVKGKKVVTTLPVFFHPAVSSAQRTHASELIKEAYQHQPQPLVAKMLAGEGGKGSHVQVLPDGAIYPAINKNLVPGGDVSFYERESNIVRINMHGLETFEARGGREEAVNLVLHESSHLLDDLGHVDQDKGYFIARGDLSDTELAPSMKHFETQRDRYEAILTNTDDKDVLRFYQLRSKGEHRTDPQEKELKTLEKRLLARSGSVSEYGVHGGGEKFSGAGGQVSEWFAETYTHFANPATRDRLREVDPVAHETMKRIHEDLDKGVSTTDAMTNALRFSLSTEVAAQQGKAMLKSGVTPDSLKNLDQITTAFEAHGRAIDGWKPFENDAALRAMRKGEATAGAKAGRELLTDIRSTLKTLPASADKTKLAAIEKRLTQALDTLEKNEKKI